MTNMIRLDDDLRGDTWVARHLPRRPRWVHRLYAFLLRYFWGPCPVCERDFGGHECGGSLRAVGLDGTGRCICLDCARFIQAQRVPV